MTLPWLRRPGEPATRVLDIEEAEIEAYEMRYLNGYTDPNKRHPFMTSTGMEGRCELCGLMRKAPTHEEPWER